MAYSFFQIPAHGRSEASEALNKLLAGGRIASVRKEFVATGEQSFWAFCVEHLDRPVPAPMNPRSGSKAPKVDYKEVLSEADFEVFSKLRDVRKALAEKEAVPAYAVFTNEQLAAIVRAKPDTATALGKIEGVGAARVGKYGAAVLEVLQQEAPVAEA